MTETAPDNKVDSSTEFVNELEELMKKYEIKAHGAVFHSDLWDNKPIILFGPNVVTGTKILRKAYEATKSQFMSLIGE